MLLLIPSLRPGATAARFEWRLCRGLLQQRWNSVGWQVSSHGRVQNTFGVSGFGSFHRSGYCRVVINNQSYAVHRLVAAAFLGPPPDTNSQVNHLDGDSCNNHVDNLRYVTPSENIKHSWATNSARRARILHIWSTPVEWRQKGEGSWSWCASQRQAETLLGIRQPLISQCCRGVRGACLGGKDGLLYEFRWAHCKHDSHAADEEWRPATYVGDDGPIANLAVSDHGRICHLLQGRQKMSHGTRRKNGYHYVNKAGRYMSVHRLVAATFLGQPSSPQLQVNHRDLDRGNNRVDNLEYVTNGQNRRHFLSQEVGPGRRITSNIPVQGRLKQNEDDWIGFGSLTAAALHTGLSCRKISRLCSQHDGNELWEFRFAGQALLPGEEWRQVVLKGARHQVGPKKSVS